MYMMFILDILVVNCVGTDAIGLMSGTEEGDEFVLELTGEFGDCLACFGANEEHFSHMGFGPGVCLHTSARP